MLFEIDDAMNISIARGYGVTFPVGIQKADSSDYDMLPTDVLTFTVRNSANSQTNIFQITSNVKSITLPSAFTSSISPFIRLSNCPLNCVPATRAVISRSCISFF